MSYIIKRKNPESAGHSSMPTQKTEVYKRTEALVNAIGTLAPVVLDLLAQAPHERVTGSVIKSPKSNFKRNGAEKLAKRRREGHREQYLATQLRLLISDLAKVDKRRESEFNSFANAIQLNTQIHTLFRGIAKRSVADNLNNHEFDALTESIMNAFSAVLTSQDVRPNKPLSQEAVRELAESIFDAMMANKKLPDRTKRLLTTFNKFIGSVLLVLLLARCAPPTEPANIAPTSTRTALVESQDDDHTGASGDGEPPASPTRIVATRTPRTEIVATTQAPTIPTATEGAGSPEPEPTKIPPIDIPSAIENNPQLLGQLTTMIKFFNLDAESQGQYFFDPNVNLEPVAHGEKVWLIVHDGSVTYQGQQYPDGSVFLMTSANATEPMLASVQGAQSVVTGAGLDQTISALIPNPVNGLPVAVNESGVSIVSVHPDSFQWVIASDFLATPEAPMVPTLLTSNDDLSSGEGVVSMLLYPASTAQTDVIKVGIDAGDQGNFNFGDFAPKMLSEADFHAAQYEFCQFDVPVASRLHPELPDAYLQVCAHVLGTYDVTYPTGAIETYLVLQTFGFDQGKVVPIVWSEAMYNPAIWDSVTWLEADGTATNAPVASANQLMTRIENANGGMIVLDMTMTQLSSAATPAIHSLLLPEGAKVPDGGTDLTLEQLIGQQVITTFPISAVSIPRAGE